MRDVIDELEVSIPDGGGVGLRNFPVKRLDTVGKGANLVPVSSQRDHPESDQGYEGNDHRDRGNKWDFHCDDHP